ncbi:uncharacterized protein LOC115880843 [Sitophilus oryzae]|nr:uncharacterized protein LOC115880843 [Sitophilus oryzae]
MGTGSGTDTVYKPKLSWFHVADSFLRQNLGENESQSNLMLPEQISEEIQGNAPSIVNEDSTQETWECEKNPFTNSREAQSCFKKLNAQPITPNQSSQEPSRDYEETPSVNSARKTKTRKRLANNGKSKEDESLDQAVKALKEVASVASNEFDAFGQHVSSQLKCLPLQEALLLQEDIQKSITTVRLRCLRNQNVINTSFDKETRTTTSSSEMYRQDDTSELSSYSGENKRYHYQQVPNEVQNQNGNNPLFSHEAQETICSESYLQGNTDSSTSSGVNEQYQFRHQGQMQLTNYFKNWAESDDAGVDFN